MNVGLSSTVCSIVLNNMLCEGCRSCWLSIKDVWANGPGEVTWRPRAVPSWHLSPTFTPRLEAKSILKLRLLALKIAPLVMWGLQGMPLILYASLLLAMISVSMLSVLGIVRNMQSISLRYYQGELQWRSPRLQVPFMFSECIWNRWEWRNPVPRSPEGRTPVESSFPHQNSPPQTSETW